MEQLFWKGEKWLSSTIHIEVSVDENSPLGIFPNPIHLKKLLLVASWHQSQLCSSIPSWDICKTRWILCLKMVKITILTQKTASNMAIIGWKWKNYNRSENGKQIAFIQDQSQPCTSIHSWDISKTSWILGLKMTKKTILSQTSACNVTIIDWNWKNYKRSETLK